MSTDKAWRLRSDFSNRFARELIVATEVSLESVYVAKQAGRYADAERLMNEWRTRILKGVHDYLAWTDDVVNDALQVKIDRIAMELPKHIMPLESVKDAMQREAK